MSVNVREFDSTDWEGLAGAVRWSRDQQPLIAYLEDDETILTADKEGFEYQVIGEHTELYFVLRVSVTQALAAEMIRVFAKASREELKAYGFVQV